MDDLKRENQKLLQIIQKLQSATLSPNGIATPSLTADCSTPALAGNYAATAAPTAATSGRIAATPSLSGAPDSIDSNPSGPGAVAAAAAVAAAVAAAEQVTSGNLTDSPLQQAPPRHAAVLLEPADSEPAGVLGASQPGFAVSAGVLSSSTLVLLPGTMSSPLPLALTHSFAGTVLRNRCTCALLLQWTVLGLYHEWRPCHVMCSCCLAICLLPNGACFRRPPGCALRLSRVCFLWGVQRIMQCRWQQVEVVDLDNMQPW